MVNNSTEQLNSVPDKQADNRGINKSSEPLISNGITAVKNKEVFADKHCSNTGYPDKQHDNSINKSP